MRQATYAPNFEGSSWGTFIVGTKAEVLRFAPSTWYGMLISMLSPVVGGDIQDAGQPTADLGETGKPWEWVEAEEKTGDRRTWKSQKLSQLAVKGLVKVTWKQTWFDLVAAGAPPEQVGWLSPTLCWSCSG